MVTRGYVTHRGYPALRRRVQKPRSARPRRRPQRHQTTHLQKATNRRKEDAAKKREQVARAKAKKEAAADKKVGKSALVVAKQAEAVEKSAVNVATLAAAGKPTAVAVAKVGADAKKVASSAKKVESAAKKAPAKKAKKTTKVKKYIVKKKRKQYVRKKDSWSKDKYQHYSDGCILGRLPKKQGGTCRKPPCRNNLKRDVNGRCPPYISISMEEATILANKLNGYIRSGKIPGREIDISKKDKKQLLASIRYRDKRYKDNLPVRWKTIEGYKLNSKFKKGDNRRIVRD
jgi:hypothetical protein